MTQNDFLPECILIPFFTNETPIVGVEIGVLGASGSFGMLLRMPFLKLYCIDPFIHIDENRYEASFDQEKLDWHYNFSKNKLEYFNERAILMRVTSDEAVNLVTEPLDFVWIDGNHEYDQVKRDIQNWKVKLKPRAIIGGHDWQNGEVQPAVLEEFKMEELKFGDDFTWWREYE